MKDRDLLAAMSVSFVTSGYARNQIMSESPTDAQIASKALILALGILEAVDERIPPPPEDTVTLYWEDHALENGEVRDNGSGGWWFEKSPATSCFKTPFTFHESDVKDRIGDSTLIRAGAKPL
jgi:hypothetical protein